MDPQHRTAPALLFDDDGRAAVVARLAPFVAWLATGDDDEPTRRRHREIVEAFLRFADHDGGSPGTRRQRFVVAHRDRAAPESSRAALSRLTEYDAVVRCTLPLDG